MGWLNIKNLRFSFDKSKSLIGEYFLKMTSPLVADENLQRVALTNAHGPADLFGNYYSPASV